MNVPLALLLHVNRDIIKLVKVMVLVNLVMLIMHAHSQTKQNMHAQLATQRQVLL